jgi:hypothetical protein
LGARGVQKEPRAKAQGNTRHFMLTTRGYPAWFPVKRWIEARRQVPA